MSVTQFAMVEELAFLIKDNLPCKHLVLSMEETLVNILQDDASSSRVLELDPMNSYNRLLIHRLADIFGFSHQSVGEGDDRHLVLECCPETSIPPILVGDLLWQYDDFQTSTSHQLLRRKEVSPLPVVDRSTLPFSLEEREVSYIAARERIFSLNIEEPPVLQRQKPRTVPVVARRMIAHALGQRIINKSSTDESVVVSSNNNECAKQTNEINILLLEKEEDSKPNDNVCELTSSRAGRKVVSEKVDSKLSSSRSGSGSAGIHGRGRRTETCGGVVHGKEKEDDMGAAKRIFAHALGFHSSSSSKAKCSSEKTKQTPRRGEKEALFSRP